MKKVATLFISKKKLNQMLEHLENADKGVYVSLYQTEPDTYGNDCFVSFKPENKPYFYFCNGKMSHSNDLKLVDDGKEKENLPF